MPEHVHVHAQEHDSGQTRSNRHLAAEGARSFVGFLARSMSKDGLEDAIFGMEQWRVSGDTPRKFQPLLSWKSH